MFNSWVWKVRWRGIGIYMETDVDDSELRFIQLTCKSQKRVVSAMDVYVYNFEIISHLIQHVVAPISR